MRQCIPVINITEARQLLSQRLDYNALNFLAYTEGIIFINASLGIKSWWGQDFLHLSRPTQPPVQWVPGFFYVGKTAVV